MILQKGVYGAVFLMFLVQITAVQTTAVGAESVEIENLVVVSGDSSQSRGDVFSDRAAGMQEQQSSLLPEDNDADSIYGMKSGYIHPYLNVRGEYTDNLYNSGSDTVTNYLVRISPGLWFALPRKKVVPVSVTPHNTSPGGLQYQLNELDTSDKIMTYALAGADVKIFSEDSALNDIDWVGEGLFRYTMNSGLSLQLLDRYTKAEDDFNYLTELRKDNRAIFNSNYLLATADWEMTEKLRLKLEYSNFWLAYDEAVDEYLNRMDNAFDIYGYFNFTEKTALFLEYKMLDVSYDESSEYDSTQDFYFAGLKWDTTEKLSLLLKLGYQNREFDLITLDGYDGFAMDMQMFYRISEKTDMRFGLYRTNEETDSVTSSDKSVWGATLDYSQGITEKISFSLNINYEDSDYRGLDAYDRYERKFYISPSIQYLLRRWLQAEIAYSFEKVDSDVETWEYETNIFMAGLNISL